MIKKKTTKKCLSIRSFYFIIIIILILLSGGIVCFQSIRSADTDDSDESDIRFPECKKEWRNRMDYVLGREEYVMPIQILVGEIKTSYTEENEHPIPQVKNHPNSDAQDAFNTWIKKDIEELLGDSVTFFSFNVRYMDESIISLQMYIAGIGGANTYSGYYTRNYDFNAQKEFELDDLFIDSPKYHKYLDQEGVCLLEPMGQSDLSGCDSFDSIIVYNDRITYLLPTHRIQPNTALEVDLCYDELASYIPEDSPLTEFYSDYP